MHAQQGKTLIQLDGVSKSYEEAERKRVVLHELSLQVNRGELVVLMGKSGSGKSTLLNLISGIDQPDAGKVCVDGQTLNQLNERARTLFRRRSVGFVFQFFNLVPTLTVRENVLLPLELNGQTGTKAERKAQTMLEAVGLGDRGASYPDRLSGGEQQRIAIARALVHDPALILADEPTGNLDVETGRQVLDLLDRLTRQAGKTIVMVTHAQFQRHPEPHQPNQTNTDGLYLEPDRVFHVINGKLAEITPNGTYA
ncbi:MAG: ABC transporter ATP-binding protein [Chloroflexia bacterium]|nr:ABC transporter ATP-binding protein [Chloroflexia bacterium]